MAARIRPVILSGGSGTRLWPLSRGAHPKQFHPLLSNLSLLQETALRFRDGERFDPPFVVSGSDARFMILEHLQDLSISPGALLLEPVGRNTAPAVAAAALTLECQGSADALMLVLPADHAIADVPAFHRAIEAGAAQAEAGRLVTFGIVPTGPETGYGYIRSGARLVDGGVAVHAIDSFVEKPDRATAEAYVQSGDYFWNSGIFLFRADVLLRELERFRPEIVSACRMAVERGKTDLAFFRLEEGAFRDCPSEALDYAVMEKTDKGAVIPVEMGWSDIGSWTALWDIEAKDEAGNVRVGDVLSRDSRNCYLRSEGKLVAAIGVQDLIVVEAGDAVLVAHRDQAQEVKGMVADLKRANRPEYQTHRRVYRPWGWYETIDKGERFQVKHLLVKPGHKLSLQMHHHRAEHWVVVSGTARVQVGEREILLTENESTYIPVGTAHRLENPGKVPLRLVEVQSGGYLGEDDIVRFDDTYGRVETKAAE